MARLRIRSRLPELDPGSVGVLAGLVRTSGSARMALEQWHHEAAPELAPPLQRLARRLRLGMPLVAALDVLAGELPGAGELPLLFGAHTDVGGDLAAMLERTVRTMMVRHDQLAAATAAAAGAKASGRLVASLPFVFALLLPVARAPLTDPVGIAMSLAGLCLTAGGMRWMSRMVPQIPRPDYIATTAATLALVVRAGASLSTALAMIAARPPEALERPLRRAARLNRLGATWPEALAHTSHDGLVALARAVAAGDSRGLPVAPALEEFATRRYSETAAAFDVAARRAPVLMVLPLVLCILPAFGLLAVAPFLRGLAGAG